MIDLGLIYSCQGSGNYIHEIERISIFIGRTQGVTYDHPGEALASKVISIDIIEADDEMAKEMQCRKHTPIYSIVRVRYIDEQPYSIEYTYYNKDIIPYLGKEICEQSIFKYIQNDLKLTFGITDKYLSVEKLNKRDSELLGLNENDPTFVIEDRVHLSNGIRFNVSKCLYNYNLAKFYTMIK